jgi:hypothetical protein
MEPKKPDAPQMSTSKLEQSSLRVGGKTYGPGEAAPVLTDEQKRGMTPEQLAQIGVETEESKAAAKKKEETEQMQREAEEALKKDSTAPASTLPNTSRTPAKGAPDKGAQDPSLINRKG